MKIQQKHVTNLMWTILSLVEETWRFVPTIIFDLEPSPKLRGHNLNVRHTNLLIQKKEEQSGNRIGFVWALKL